MCQWFSRHLSGSSARPLFPLLLLFLLLIIFPLLLLCASSSTCMFWLIRFQGFQFVLHLYSGISAHQNCTVNFHLLSLVNCGLRILYFLWCLLDRMGVFFIGFISKSGYCKSFKSTGKKRRRKKPTQVLHMSYYGLIMSVMPAPYDRSTVFGPGPRIALQTMCRKQCLHSHSVSVGKLLWGYPAPGSKSPMRTSVAMYMYLYKYSLILTNLIF